MCYCFTTQIFWLVSVQLQVSYMATRNEGRERQRLYLVLIKTHAFKHSCHLVVYIYKCVLGLLRKVNCWKRKQDSLDLTMCGWRGKIGNEAKRERECRKPLATCLQSAICWWQGSWRGGAQRPFLAMRSSLINKTKRVSCVTPICYLYPCSRTPFISI